MKITIEFWEQKIIINLEWLGFLLLLAVLLIIRGFYG